MALPKISEVRELSDVELAEQVIAVKKQLFQLRLQKATRQLDKPHQFKHAKHRLAQLLSVEHERKRASAPQDKDAGASFAESAATPQTSLQE